MPIVLALAAAAVWGAADFLGGLASRRLAAIRVLFLSQLVGLAALLATVLVVPGRPSTADLLWGTIGGLAGNAGLYGLYRELARGTAGVVAPTTAVSAALTPVAVGLAMRDVPAPITMAGVVVAIVAVALLAGEESHHSPGSARQRRLPVGFWVAIASGIGFGAFYVCLAQTSTEAGLWPLVASRLASVVVMAFIPSAWRRTPRGINPGAGPAADARPRPTLMAGAAGILDATANAAYVTAVRLGSLTWVPVLASLYPASTVLLARVVQGQRLGRRHAVGLVLALTAVAMVTSGSG